MRPHRTYAPPRRPRWRSAALLGATAALTATWISGCSVLYDLNTAQCSSTADCVALGGVFSEFECIDSLCQQPPGCESHAECMDSLGSGIEPYACVDRQCVALKTAECPTVLPQIDELWRENLRSNNPLILAGTGVLSGGNNYDPRLKTYDLALAEFTRKVGGIDSGTRRLVMLGCKANVASNEELDRMMTHLQRVKVPGFAAALLADDLQYAFQTYGQPSNMFFMSPFESDPALATFGDSGLLWHIGPGSDVIARAYAPLLARTLTHLNVTGPVRVATVVASDQRFLTNMMSTITAPPESHGLSFNGKGVSGNLVDGNYIGVTVAAGEASSTAQVAELLAFKPHVVISAGASEFYANIIAGLESAWDAGDGQPKPFYLLSPFNYNDELATQLIDQHPTLRTRLAGVNGAGAVSSTNYERYLVAYQSEFELETGYENFYDAAYYLIYSAAAVASTSSLSTGEDFPRGMRRLLSGTPFNVGQTDIANALLALATGASIELSGTMGPPDWRENGTRDMPGSVWCIGDDGSVQADVLRYAQQDPDDATTASLTGTFPCIPGF